MRARDQGQADRPAQRDRPAGPIRNPLRDLRTVALEIDELRRQQDARKRREHQDRKPDRGFAHAYS